MPHLLILADDRQALAQAAGVVHPGSDPEGGATSAPTTVLIDRQGIVRWLYRPGEAISRLSPDILLDAIDAQLPARAEHP
jgi:peroxiredoxin